MEDALIPMNGAFSICVAIIKKLDRAILEYYGNLFFCKLNTTFQYSTTGVKGVHKQHFDNYEFY